jgi:hypothetical protein
MAIDTSMLRFTKGRTRKSLKGSKRRLEAARVQLVRAICVERDGDCRLRQDGRLTNYADQLIPHICSGETEWAHFGAKKRSKTRGLPPEVRHTTEDSLMLCTGAHTAYDHQQMFIEPLTDRGCNGPLRFRRIA